MVSETSASTKADSPGEAQGRKQPDNCAEIIVSYLVQFRKQNSGKKIDADVTDTVWCNI